MTRSASDLAAALAHEAEAVCRHYLSNGRRRGRYWCVGDLANTPGRSLFVRLSGSGDGTGAAGKWTDAATGEHGDLLDIVRASCGLSDFAEVAEEARRFLRLQRPDSPQRKAMPSAATGSPEAARRLFAMSRPVQGTLAETYLADRGLVDLPETDRLRFHPRCYYRPDPHSPTETWPALIAAVTDPQGRITGVQRTYLDPDGFGLRSLGKAPIDTPRRAMGHLRGNGVRFGTAADLIAAGEGLETVLSIRQAFPALPGIAALSATNLGLLDLPPTLRRLYILRDADPAGTAAVATLSQRANASDIDAVVLTPSREDLNEDLMAFGADVLRDVLHSQFMPEDVDRVLHGRCDGQAAG